MVLIFKIMNIGIIPISSRFLCVKKTFGFWYVKLLSNHTWATPEIFPKRGIQFYEEKTIINQSPSELTRGGGGKNLHQTMLRGVINQECKSLHKIWRNKLQKCLTACKKGIDVVVRFQYSKIGWHKNSAFHRQLKKKSTPLYICKKKC